MKSGAELKKIRRFFRNVSGVLLVFFIFFSTVDIEDVLVFDLTRFEVNLTSSSTFVIKISKLCLRNVDTFFKIAIL